MGYPAKTDLIKIPGPSWRARLASLCRQIGAVKRALALRYEAAHCHWRNYFVEAPT